MTNNQFYISVGISDIPWDSIPHFYGRSCNFSDLLNEIVGHDILKINAAVQQLQTNIVHQDGICLATPFTLIFLLRAMVFSKFKTDKIQSLIATVKAATDYQISLMEGEDYLKDAVGIFDLMNEVNLLPTFENDEQEIHVWNTFDFGRTHNSVIYNTHQILEKISREKI